MGCPDWQTAMHSLRLQRLLWIYRPGHAGVSGNDWSDRHRLASTADITSGLQLGGAEVLRGLRSFLNMDRPEHHSIDRLKERGVEKGSGLHSTLHSRERSVFNQTNIGTVSRATLWRLQRETGRSAHEPFRALRCHLELKLTLANLICGFYLSVAAGKIA